MKEQDSLKTASEGLFLGLLEFAPELVGKGILATLLQVMMLLPVIYHILPNHQYSL